MQGLSFLKPVRRTFLLSYLKVCPSFVLEASGMTAAIMAGGICQAALLPGEHRILSMVFDSSHVWKKWLFGSNDVMWADALAGGRTRNLSFHWSGGVPQCGLPYH